MSAVYIHFFYELDTLKRVMAQAISEKLKVPITSEEVTAIKFDVDDDGELKTLEIEIDIPDEKEGVS